MSRNVAMSWLGIVLGFSFWVAEARAVGILYVNAFAPGANDGSSWCNAFTELQDALTAAAGSGGGVTEVRVAGGVYRPDRGMGQTTGDRTSTFRLVRNVAIQGGYAGCGAPVPDSRDFVANETVLDGDLLENDLPGFGNRNDNAYHVVTNNDGQVTSSTMLDGFTIRGGFANGTLAAKTDQGSGLHNHSGVSPLFGGGPTVSNCIFRDNWSANHGAVNDHGGMTLINCDFRDNYAGQWGGGLYIHETLQTIVTGCRFFNNHTDGTSGGGGGVVHEGRATFTNCLFEGNTTLTRGGGFYNHSGGVATLTSCTFQQNRSDSTVEGGGALYNNASEVHLSSCQFIGNTSNQYGPAVYNFDNAVLHATGCEFRGNLQDLVEGGGGGGIANRQQSLTVLRNCVFDGNRAYWGAGLYNENSDALVTGCVFLNGLTNVAGGIYSSSSSFGDLSRLSVVNCDFRKNPRGALYAFAGLGSEHSATVVNTQVVNNGLHPYAGGILNEGADMQLINSTIVANHGGVHTQRGNTTLSNCILWDNHEGSLEDETTQISQADDFGIFVVEVNVNQSCVEGWTGALGGVGNFGADPKFLNALGPDGLPGTADDDLRLRSDSPCINTGGVSALPDDLTDLDNDGDFLESVPSDLLYWPRVSGPTVDLGAYECTSQSCVNEVCLFADVDANGLVNLGDINTIVKVFQGLPPPPSNRSADVFPCGGDGRVDLRDAYAGVNAFQGAPPCPNVCN